MYFTKAAIVALTALSSMTMTKCDKAFEENPPFKVGFSYSQKWTGGTQQAGHGINLVFAISDIDPTVALDSVYYLNHKVALHRKGKDVINYVGYITYKNKEDMVMSGNQYDEIGNPVPVVASNSEYELTAEEAVIEYRYQGKTYYTKVDKIAEKEQLNYPSANDGFRQ